MPTLCQSTSRLAGVRLTTSSRGMFLARPIEEPWLRIDAVSGASAGGAMNAAMLARGWTAAGPRQHRAPLHNKAFANSEPDGPDWRQKQLTRHDGSNRRRYHVSIWANRVHADVRGDAHRQRASNAAPVAIPSKPHLMWGIALGGAYPPGATTSRQLGCMLQLLSRGPRGLKPTTGIGSSSAPQSVRRDSAGCGGSI